MIECDVLVVGAGPAGASAARAAAIGGAKTVLIDKKKEIGVPVQCGENINDYLIPFLPYKIPKNQLIWRITGIISYAEGITIQRQGKYWSGYAINRRNFDKWLAKKAVINGAELLTNTELVGLLIKDDYKVNKAIIKTHKNRKIIKPKIFIAADGANSKVLNELGFNNLEDKCGKVLSFEMDNLDLNTPKFNQIYVGDFAPGAYAYIFPLSRKKANIGVVSLNDKKLEKNYEEFLELSNVEKQVKNGIKSSVKSGIAPYKYFTDKWIYGNILLVGDAASQNLKPFGDGILPAMICGHIAGNIARKHLVQPNKISLNLYTKFIKDKFGQLIKISDEYINAIDEINAIKSDNKKKEMLLFGIYAGVISPRQVRQFKNKNYNTLKRFINNEHKDFH